MKFLMLLLIVVSVGFFSIIPDADAKTWKVHVLDMPKQWESQFGNLYDEGTSYWEKRYPGTYFIQEPHREKADFVVQWSSQFQGTKLGYYTPSSNNDLGRPYIAITLGFMDDESVKWQDRKFNLVDAEYAKLITIHEIGHAIGFDHSKDPNDIMYPTIYNYDGWLLAKEHGSFTNNIELSKNVMASSSENVITQYRSKSLEIQEEVNFKVEKAKEHVFLKQNFLLSKQFENPDAKNELNKALVLLDEAKNYLKQAEETQKQGEYYLMIFDPEESYYKYAHSTEMVNKVWQPINGINDIVESAEKLELEYQETKETRKIQEKSIEQKKEKTCFWIFCW